MTMSGKRLAAVGLSTITALALAGSAFLSPQRAQASTRQVTTHVVHVVTAKSSHRHVVKAHTPTPKPKPTSPSPTTTPTPTPSPTTTPTGSAAPTQNPAPIGATAPIGTTTNGSIAAYASTGTTTEVWVGGDAGWVRYAGLPAGTVSNAFTGGNIVRVVLENPTTPTSSGAAQDSYTVWTLDTATGATTNRVLAASVYDGQVIAGPQGYWVYNADPANPDMWVLYAWDGSQLRVGPGNATPRTVGPTSTVFTKGMGGGRTVIESIALAGNSTTTDPSTGNTGGTIGRFHLDATGTTYVNTSVPSSICRLDAGATQVTCTTLPWLVAPTTGSILKYDVYQAGGVTVITDPFKHGFWVMPSGDYSNPTFIPDADYANARLSDSGNEILLDHGTGAFQTFTATGTEIQAAAAVH